MRQAELMELSDKYEELKKLVTSLLKVDELMAYEICKLTGQPSKRGEIKKRIDAARVAASSILSD